VLIDTIWSERVPSDQGIYGDIGWDHRILASRTTDGEKVFVSWSDTDTTYHATNRFPDIKAWGLDVNTGDQTDVVNFTRNTSYAANNFFQYMSDITLYKDCKYFIGMTTADLGTDPGDPVGHYFLGGVELEFYCVVDAMFTAPDTVVVNNTVNFTDASTGSPTYWEWDFGDGNTSTTQNPTHTFNLTGGDTIQTYTVKLTAGNLDCCTTYEMNIVVTTIGIKEIKANIDIDIYPNPAKNVLNIVTSRNIDNISIYNAYGRLVAEQYVGDKQCQINTSDLTTGMYFIQINTEVGYTTRKINIVK